MGNICSKSGVHSGGHTVLGSASGYETVTGTPSSRVPKPDARSAAAEAAERRLQQAQTRGAPNRGKLAAQAAKPVNPREIERREDERVVWD